jgi:hypothetical protein
MVLLVLLTGATVGCDSHRSTAESSSCPPTLSPARFCTVGLPDPVSVTVVTSTSSSDVWAFKFDSPVEAAWHWNGRSWQKTGLKPSAGQRMDTATEVAPDDVWIAANPIAPSGQGVFEHWDGKNWRSYPAPPGHGRSEVNAIRVGAGHSVWAIDRQRSLLEKWDGSAWRVVNAPGLTRHSNVPPIAPGRGDVWITANRTAEHWDGRSWRILPRPPGSPLVDPWSSPVDMVATADDDVWLSYGGIRGSATLAHWDGKAWRLVSVSTTLGTFTGQIAADGHGGLWLAVDPGNSVQPVTTVDQDGVHGLVGGLVHRTAAGAVRQFPGLRPSYRQLAEKAPTNGSDRTDPPWNDTVAVRLQCVVPGTGTVWLTQSHRLEDPDLNNGEYNEDYSHGDLHLVQRLG